MTNKIVLLACFVVCLQTVFSASAPFIKKCKLDDAKCLKSSSQAAIPVMALGVPDLGIEVLDPIKFKTLDASSPSLNLKLTDASATGIKDCVAKKVQFPSKTKLLINLLCTVDAHAKYEMSGALSVLKIEGKGDAHVVLRKLLISVDADMKEVTGPDGQKHFHIPSFKHNYELKDQSTVEFSNLFNGNEVLGRAAQDLIKSSPNDIVLELGPPIVKAIITRVIKNCNNMFSKVPISEISE